MSSRPPGEPDPVVAYITAIQSIPALSDDEAATTPLLDLIEEGNVALVEAVERMGSDERSFQAFARRRIKAAIARAAD